MNNNKIVSFHPAATEIIFALEIDKLLMGRSHECTFPYETKYKRALSRPKWGVNNSGEYADEIVTDLFNASFSPYDIHTKALLKMQPDVIITSSMREECGLSEEDFVSLVQSELGYEAQIIDLQIHSIQDLFDAITKIGEVMDVEGRAKRYSKLLRNRIKHISAITEQIEENHEILFFEWLNPTMVTGGWIPDVIEQVGATHLLTSTSEKSQEISFEQLENIDPEIIVVGAKGLSLDEVMDELGKMKEYPKWHSLTAVKNKRVYAVNSQELFSVGGPRMLDAMEVFCDLLYPKNFLFGHKGKNFIPIRF